MGKSKSPKWERGEAEFTPAQRIMRDDIAAGRHRNTLPEPIGVVLEGVMGKEAPESSVAIEVISKGPNLQLSFEQWSIVQGLIEEGVRRGKASNGVVNKCRIHGHAGCEVSWVHHPAQT